MINITADDNAIDWHYESYLQDYLQGLLNMSTYEGKAREGLEIAINNINMTKEEYDKISFNLFNNQLDRISSGLPYSQTDILKHLKKLC